MTNWYTTDVKYVTKIDKPIFKKAKKKQIKDNSRQRTNKKCEKTASGSFWKLQPNEQNSLNKNNYTKVEQHTLISVFKTYKEIKLKEAIK